MITDEQIENWFTYHPPTPEQLVKYQAIRAAARNFATEIARDGVAFNVDLFEEVVEANCPEGVEREWALAYCSEIEDSGTVDLGDDERDEAIMKLRDAVMWANAAIACGGSK